MRATRHDNVRGLKGAMQRSEFYDFIVRMALAGFTKRKASESLEEFVKIYILPVYEIQPITRDRKIIHESKRLNSLLYDNRVVIQYIFDNAREGFYGV
jgi:hypothetical protein